jgi:hypothetical protein
VREAVVVLSRRSVFGIAVVGSAVVLAVVAAVLVSDDVEDETAAQIAAPGITVPQLECDLAARGGVQTNGFASPEEAVERYARQSNDLPDGGYRSLGRTQTHAVFGHRDPSGRLRATVSTRRSGDRWVVHGIQACN